MNKNPNNINNSSNTSELPLVTFIIPTYQSEPYLDKCLCSIFMQDYPRDKMVVLVIDWGSTDRTLNIAKKYDVKIINNKKRIAEYAKIIGIRETQWEYFILFDSDNEIVEAKWLRDMVKPILTEPEKVFWVESRLAADEKMNSLDRCFARMRVADPMARLLWDRVWKCLDRWEYHIPILKKDHILITWANWFLRRKSLILPLIEGKTKFKEANMSNIVFRQTELSYAIPNNLWIRHYYCESFWDFYEKRKKIAGKMNKRISNNQYSWVKNTSMTKIIMVTLYFLTFVWPLIIATKNAIRDKTLDWFWYPVLSFMTVVIYLKYLFFNTLYLFCSKKIAKFFN